MLLLKLSCLVISFLQPYLWDLVSAKQFVEHLRVWSIWGCPTLLVLDYSSVSSSLSESSSFFSSFLLLQASSCCPGPSIAPVTLHDRDKYLKFSDKFPRAGKKWFPVNVGYPVMEVPAALPVDSLRRRRVM
jgi:hypothetical protein